VALLGDVNTTSEEERQRIRERLADRFQARIVEQHAEIEEVVLALLVAALSAREVARAEAAEAAAEAQKAAEARGKGAGKGGKGRGRARGRTSDPASLERARAAAEERERKLYLQHIVECIADFAGWWSAKHWMSSQGEFGCVPLKAWPELEEPIARALAGR